MATYAKDRGGLTHGSARYTAVVAATDAADSDRLPMAEFVRGVVMTSSTETATSLALYGVVGSSTGTAYTLHTTTGGAVSMTVAASRTTQLSTAAAGLEWLAFQADASASLAVVLKS